MEDLSAAELLDFLKRRNLFYGMSLPELRAAVAEFSRPLRVSIYGEDAKPGLPETVDFAILPRRNDLPSGAWRQWTEEARAALGSRVYVIDGGTVAIIQKLRDIASLNL